MEWIEVITEGNDCRKLLKSGDKPEAEFEIRPQKIVVTECCNIHGLWKSD
ncbi:desulfoferrodoxin family protein [Chloroflexota bacterium]